MPRFPLDRRTSGPQYQSGRSKEKKILDTTRNRTQTELLISIFQSKILKYMLNSIALYVTYEVLIAFSIISCLFCNIALCSPVKLNRRLGRTYRIIFRIKKKANQDISMKLAVCFVLVLCLAQTSALKMEGIYSFNALYTCCMYTGKQAFILHVLHCV